jgi:hypothetical protein
VGTKCNRWRSFPDQRIFGKTSRGEIQFRVWKHSKLARRCGRGRGCCGLGDSLTFRLCIENSESIGSVRCLGVFVKSGKRAADDLTFVGSSHLRGVEIRVTSKSRPITLIIVGRTNVLRLLPNKSPDFIHLQARSIQIAHSIVHKSQADAGGCPSNSGCPVLSADSTPAIGASTSRNRSMCGTRSPAAPEKRRRFGSGNHLISVQHLVSRRRARAFAVDGVFPSCSRPEPAGISKGLRSNSSDGRCGACDCLTAAIPTESRTYSAHVRC